MFLEMYRYKCKLSIIYLHIWLIEVVAALRTTGPGAKNICAALILIFLLTKFILQVVLAVLCTLLLKANCLVSGCRFSC